MSSGMLVALAALVSFKQFGGRPVECMVPDTFTKAWEEFAENFCFAKNTYFLPFSFLIPEDQRSRRDREISYYQWVPFFLLFEAGCFQLPFLLWRLLATHSGLKIHEIVRQSKDPGNLKMAAKNESLTTVRIHLENALRFHRRLQRRKFSPHNVCRCFNLPYTSSYVTSMYLFIKILYMVNVGCQFFLLNSFLMTGTEYQWVGWGAMRDIIHGDEWEESGYFPRVTLCDINVRVMGNIQPHTMQCVLVINILNEKIFIFLWFWYQGLLILTACSFVYWLCILVIPYFSTQYIKRHLELGDLPVSFNKDNNKDVTRFVHSYLHRDGIFVLRMVEMHAGIIFACDLTVALWDSYYGIEEIRCEMGELTDKFSGERKSTDKKPMICPSAPCLPLSNNPIEQRKMSRFFYRRAVPPMNPAFAQSHTASLCTTEHELPYYPDPVNGFRFPRPPLNRQDEVPMSTVSEEEESQLLQNISHMD